MEIINVSGYVAEEKIAIAEVREATLQMSLLQLPVLELHQMKENILESKAVCLRSASMLKETLPCKTDPIYYLLSQLHYGQVLDIFWL